MKQRLVCQFDLHYANCQRKEECTRYEPCGRELLTDESGKLYCVKHGEDI